MVDAPVLIWNVVAEYRAVCVASVIICGRPEGCGLELYIARVFKITVYDTAGRYSLESRGIVCALIIAHIAAVVSGTLP